MLVLVALDTIVLVLVALDTIELVLVALDIVVMELVALDTIVLVAQDTMELAIAFGLATDQAIKLQSYLMVVVVDILTKVYL